MINLTEINRQNLFPFTHTRHIADIRIGILTIREKWAMLIAEGAPSTNEKGSIDMPANIIPTKENFKSLLDLATTDTGFPNTAALPMLNYSFNIFQLNDLALRSDFNLITEGRRSQNISGTNALISPENIFSEEGAIVEHSILNASSGPIYIGKNAEIAEGCMIRGPFSLGENARLKMGTKVYGAATIGPNCIVGGEIKNSVLFANSNKAHDGYLGDSVIGEWCNLGAGTTNSNVKNTGGAVGYVLHKEATPIYAGNKGGLLMGDYSRAAINTSFNTGAVTGVCCNIFGEKMPAKFTDNFTWGHERYIFEKAIRDIDNWKKMKGQSITEEEITVLKNLYAL